MGTKLVERGITRYDIEQQGTYGFMVRISRDGEHVNEFFSDKNNGGKRKALIAARARYQELKKKLPPPKTTKGIVTGRNRTGIVGVHLAVCESVYGESYSSYCASWKSKDGRRKKLSFSFKKYGERKAWELACLARELEVNDRKKVEKLYPSWKKKGNASPLPKPGASKKKKAAKKKVKKKLAKKKKVKAKKKTTKKNSKTKNKSRAKKKSRRASKKKKR